ncbi:uncharacterized protein TM35_000041070 [Trypanosoma theileri]|uniref:Uncharacterized protein n=1 Tax=Trypanosoma theileri TaxID=67003 RepID=A0A1X0P5G9_9TRYP|nr:uncharacterized protein TM35_000041070 [Trypanosoma theileri]ORC91893.1 hypothetical protein TM35_000041070 [Trypanosoma theileri]
MTTMFVQLRGVVYLLVLLQFCVCVCLAGVSGAKSEVEQAEGGLKRWLEDVEKQLPGAKSCQNVWEEHNKKYKEQADRVVNLTKEMEEIVRKTKELGKKWEPSGSSVAEQADAEEMIAFVDTVSKNVSENKKVIAAARLTVEEARKLVDCTTFLGNLEDLITDNKKENLNYWKGELEEEIKKSLTIERQESIRELIRKSKETEDDVGKLVDKLRLNKVRSAGYSREVIMNLGNATDAVQTAVEKFESLKEEVEKKKSGFKEKVDELRKTRVSVTARRQISTVEPKVSSNESGEYPAKEVEWKATAGGSSGASPVTGASGREYGVPLNTNEIVQKLNEEVEKEKKILEQKKIEEKKALEEKIKAEIRRKEEEERARLAAEEERAAKERARVAEEEKKAAEEKARQDEERARMEAEKKAKEEKARLEAERLAKEKAKQKKKDGSSPALVHSSLILLVLSVLGCTLVC